jgi:hypothetical protein
MGLLAVSIDQRTGILRMNDAMVRAVRPVATYVFGQLSRSAMMNELETHSRPPAGRVREQPAVTIDVRSQLGKCLVVSATQSKREAISYAASEAGWDTIVCDDAPSALAAVQRAKFQLAWVDLESPAAPVGFRDLCGTIAALRQVLLVVCGCVNDVQEEIWARQLGVWLYLPGVALDDLGEIALLCSQARLVSRKTTLPSGDQ